MPGRYETYWSQLPRFRICQVRKQTNCVSPGS